MKNRWKQILIGTFASMNLMLLALLFSRDNVIVVSDVPSIAGTSAAKNQVELDWELVETRKVPEQSENPETGSAGFWSVERYREYEYHYDARGRLVSKVPTGKETALRYWNAGRSDQ
jgi:hypothetical protein